MNKAISWEPWLDYPDEVVDEQETEENEAVWKDGEDDENSIASLLGPPETVSTPLGIYPANDNLLPSRLFSCWILHTNFDIDEDVIEIIRTTPGVEAASLMSRYRMFIGVGKLFNDKQVRWEIHHSLLADEEAGRGSTEDEAMQAKRWALIIAPTGRKFYICTNEDEDADYDRNLDSFRHIAQNHGLELIVSDENGV